MDYAHPEVRNDVKDWGPWVSKQLGLNGFRFDAIKVGSMSSLADADLTKSQHYSEGFLLEFIENLDKQLGHDTFCVGEFWKTSRDSLTAYLDKMHHKFTLFDAPLVESFHRISSTERGDLRSVWDGTLTQVEPWNSVTLVMNHDTQPSQALQIDIADWFIPLAHAFILLRIDGYPCIFYGNIYGIKGGVENNWRGPSNGGKIPDMVGGPKPRKVSRPS